MVKKNIILDMSIEHKEFVEKAKTYLVELVPSATEVSFEELGHSLSVENPPNAFIVVLSYKDSNSNEGIQKLFSKKQKSIYMDSQSGALLAIKNKLSY